MLRKKKEHLTHLNYHSISDNESDEEKNLEEDIKKSHKILFRPVVNDPIAGLLMCSGLPLFHFVFGSMIFIVIPWENVSCYNITSNPDSVSEKDTRSFTWVFL